MVQIIAEAQALRPGSRFKRSRTWTPRAGQAYFGGNSGEQLAGGRHRRRELKTVRRRGGERLPYFSTTNCPHYPDFARTKFPDCAPARRMILIVVEAQALRQGSRFKGSR